MAGQKREPAVRVYASEYSLSNLESKGEEEYAPSYLITPLGAMINRVYFVGVLTEKENVGSELEPFWKARVKDPTGTFFLSAGTYQPEASQQLRDIQPPCLVAVIGKTKTFSAEDGRFYVSVRPERISQVTKEERDYWIYTAAQQTRKRIQDYEKAVSKKELEEPVLLADGFDANQAKGIVSAVSHYGIVDLASYKDMIRESLRFIVSGKEVLPEDESDYPEEVPVPQSQMEDADVQMFKVGEEEEYPEDGTEEPAPKPVQKPQPKPVQTPPPAKPEPEPSEDESIERKVLEAVKELSKSTKGAAYSEVMRKLGTQGVNKTRFEEAVNLLMDKGIIYEPSANWLKTVN